MASLEFTATAPASLALDLAMHLSAMNNLDPSLQEDLDMNEANIRGLLEEKNEVLEENKRLLAELKSIKKELRKMERDYDVLYFDYQMARSDEPEERKGKCMAIE
jgi:septal ring factor EnvC (AmiA/AmiB activator)